MSYDPLVDSPEAATFHVALDEDRVVRKEADAFIDSGEGRDPTGQYITFPDDLRERLRISSAKLSAAYAAYMAVVDA